MKTSKQGSISLTTVLVVGAMLLLSGAILIYSSLNLIESTENYHGYKLSVIHATTCLEEAMAKIKVNPTYTGSNEFQINSGSCSYQVSNQNGDPTKKIIFSKGFYAETSYSSTYIADTTKSPLTIDQID